MSIQRTWRPAPIAVALLTLLLSGPLTVHAQAPSASPAPAACISRGDPIVPGQVADPIYGRVTEIEASGPYRIAMLTALDPEGSVSGSERAFGVGWDACSTLAVEDIAIGSDLVISWVDERSDAPRQHVWPLMWLRRGDRWTLESADPDLLAVVPAELQVATTWWDLLAGIRRWQRAVELGPEHDIPPPDARPVRLTVPVTVSGTAAACPAVGGCAYVLTLQAEGSAITGAELVAGSDGTLSAPGGVAAAPGSSLATLDVWARSDEVVDGVAPFLDVLATCRMTVEVPIAQPRLALVVEAKADACSIAVAGPD